MPPTFRADGEGARQRFVHWAAASIALILLATHGVVALAAYIAGVFLLHVRLDKARSSNVMELLLDARTAALTRGWNRLREATTRRAVSLPGRRPHRFVAILGILLPLGLAVYLNPLVGDGAIEFVTRLAIAVAASATAWIACFGVKRRTTLVLGSDGIRVQKTFIPNDTLTDVELDERGRGVVIRRSPPMDAVVVPTSDQDGARHLLTLLFSEVERARARRNETATTIAVGFRENAHERTWRARVSDAKTDEERAALLARAPGERLHELLEDTADAQLEEAIQHTLDERE